MHNVKNDGTYYTGEIKKQTYQDTNETAILFDYHNKYQLSRIKVNNNIYYEYEYDHKGNLAIYKDICNNKIYFYSYNENNILNQITDQSGINLSNINPYRYPSYRVTATIKLHETQFYANWQLWTGSQYMLIYASGAGQLSFLQPYKDQEVTLEMALVNWNGKALRAAVIAIILPDGTKVPCNTNFR